ncbi:YigZ family protein [Xanthomonas hortorum pv. pelargonii]|nr:YigZ family protein [Xanthomonas hortorum pv. pelargonii]
MAAASGTSGSHAEWRRCSDTPAADAHPSLDIKLRSLSGQRCCIGIARARWRSCSACPCPMPPTAAGRTDSGREYRSSDDGEPSGTAGRPILAAIDGQGYDRVVVVVTRWYGGIKLGAGGLMRAYGGTAAECLRMATRRPLMTLCALELQCRFDDLGVVHVALNAFHATKLNERFDATGALLDIHQRPINFSA